MSRRIPTPGLATALTAALALLLTACTNDPDTPTGDESSISSTPADMVAVIRLADLPADTLLTPGPYAMGVDGEADAPMVVIDVPAGFLGGGDGLEIASDEGSFRHFGTWTVAEVAAQACGTTNWVDPGPSVEELADALAALPVWESTEPTPTTIGGYEGVSMELNVPADLPDTCQAEPHSWRDLNGGTQGVGPGKTQRLWLVDVDGQRIMLIAGYFPGPEGPTAAQIDEMTQMAEGATFVDADQLAP